MPRVFGVLAIFGGWLCILLSAVFGLLATQFLGLDHVEGALPPSGVYGVPSVTILWVTVGTAVLTAVPAGAAMFARDPSRRLYVAAAVMAGVAVILLPDDLGRAYSAALLPGAALLAAGGWWTHQAGGIGDESPSLQTDAATSDTAAGPAPTPVVSAGGPAPATAPAAATGAPVPAGTESVAGAAAPVKRSTARSARAAAKSRQAADAQCPWCSAGIAAAADRCPSCGAALTSGAELSMFPIPGVTDVAPELRAYEERAQRQKKRTGLLSMVLGDPDDRLFASPVGEVDPLALRPPSADVRAEMERIDREIAAGTIAGERVPAPETAPETASLETPRPEAPAPEAPTPADPGPASDT